MLAILIQRRIIPRPWIFADYAHLYSRSLVAMLDTHENLPHSAALLGEQNRKKMESQNLPPNDNESLSTEYSFDVWPASLKFYFHPYSVKKYWSYWL